MGKWATLVCIFYLLEITVVHTLDDPFPTVVHTLDDPSPENEITTPKPLIKKKDPRIVGGTPAIMGQFPYQVLIYIRTSSGTNLCGGTIIGEQYVLTAAHCMLGVSANSVEVSAGHINRSNSKTHWIRSTVSEIFVHEDYMTDIVYNDVALLKLHERYSLDGQHTAALKLRDTEVPGATVCTVSGWGTTKEGGSVASILQYINVPIVDRHTCSGLQRRSVYEGEICAGYSSGGMDACQGDSGGPLVCDEYLTGVVSWGEGCAREKKPGVYANVVWYKDWIEERTLSVNPDEHPTTVAVPSENPNPDERDTDTGKDKGVINGFANGIVVLSFVSVLTYLFN